MIRTTKPKNVCVFDFVMFQTYKIVIKMPEP